MPEFDSDAAAKAGFSPAEVAKIQSGIVAARAAGVPDSEIFQHLQTIQPGQLAPAVALMNPVLRWPLGMASAAVRGIDYGLGAPGDLERLGVKYINNPLARLTGIGHEEPTDENYFGIWPTSESYQGITNKLGLTGQPSLAPQSSAERLAQAGVSGLTSMIPIVAAERGLAALPGLLGGTATTPVYQTGRALLSGETAGLAAQGAAELGAPPLVQAGVGLVAGAGSGAARRRPETVDQVVADLPGASTTIPQAGAALADGAQQFRTGLPDKLATAEAPMADLVPAEAPHLPDSLVMHIDEKLAEGGPGARAVRQFMGQTIDSGGALGATAEKLAGLSSDERLRGLSLGDLADEFPTFTWDEGRKLRTALGEHLADTSRPSEKSALKFLYGGATDDLFQTANAHGAGDQFLLFNQESTRLHNLNEGPIEDILTRSPEAAASRLLTTGMGGGRTTDLHDLRVEPEMAPAIDELASAHLNNDPNLRAWLRFSPETQEGLVPGEAIRDRLAAIAAANPKSAPSLATRIGQHQLGLWIGGAGGTIAGSLLPGGASAGREMVTQAAGELLGAAWPNIVSGTRRALNPLTLAPGVVGPEGRPSVNP